MMTKEKSRRAISVTEARIQKALRQMMVSTAEICMANGDFRDAVNFCRAVILLYPKYAGHAREILKQAQAQIKSRTRKKNK
jgi:hypothetical protein